MTSAPERSQEEKLAAIAHYFDLGEIVASQPILHATNQNYLVTTPKGDYLFKIIVNTTLHDVLEGLPFLQRLEEEQFSATAYYLPTSGGEMAYHSAGCDAVVLKKLPGAIPELSPAVCREVGVYLAKLHLIPCDGLPEKRHWLDARYLPEAMQKALDLYGPAPLRETTAVFHSLRSFQPARLPQSILHGDLCPVNSLFERERLVAFVDWQEIGVGAALMDFASTVLGFCFREQDANADFWAIFDPRALFEGYTSLCPFSSDELEQLDAALKYVGLTQPVWSMLNWQQYHPGEEMIETNTRDRKYGLDALVLPQMK